jgi:hypothetical protein
MTQKALLSVIKYLIKLKSVLLLKEQNEIFFF